MNLSFQKLNAYGVLWVSYKEGFWYISSNACTETAKIPKEILKLLLYQVKQKVMLKRITLGSCGFSIYR